LASSAKKATTPYDNAHRSGPLPSQRNGASRPVFPIASKSFA
jgi:hypothetical protein